MRDGGGGERRERRGRGRERRGVEEKGERVRDGGGGERRGRGFNSSTTKRVLGTHNVQE